MATPPPATATASASGPEPDPPRVEHEVPDSSIDPTLRDLPAPAPAPAPALHLAPSPRPRSSLRRARRKRPLTVSLDYTDSEHSSSSPSAGDEFRPSDLEPGHDGDDDDDLDLDEGLASFDEGDRLQGGDIVVGQADPALSATAARRVSPPSRPTELGHAKTRPLHDDQVIANRARPMAKQRKRLIEIGALPAGRSRQCDVAAYGETHLRSVERGQRARSCENCRMRKQRCSSHQVCRGCLARNEQCVWIVGAPLYPLNYAGPLDPDSRASYSPVLPPHPPLRRDVLSSRVPLPIPSALNRDAHRSGPGPRPSDPSSGVSLPIAPSSTSPSSSSVTAALRFPAVTYASLIAERSRLIKTVELLSARWSDRERHLARIERRDIERCVALRDVPLEREDDESGGRQRRGRDEGELEVGDGARGRGEVAVDSSRFEMIEGEVLLEGAGEGRGGDVEGRTSGDLVGDTAVQRGGEEDCAREETVAPTQGRGELDDTRHESANKESKDKAPELEPHVEAVGTGVDAGLENGPDSVEHGSQEVSEDIRVAPVSSETTSDRHGSVGGRTVPPMTTSLPVTAPYPHTSLHHTSTMPPRSRDRTEWEDAAILLTLSQPQAQSHPRDRHQGPPTSSARPPPNHPPRPAKPRPRAHRPMPPPPLPLREPPRPRPLPPPSFNPPPLPVREPIVPYVESRQVAEEGLLDNRHRDSSTIDPNLISGGGYIHPGATTFPPPAAPDQKQRSTEPEKSKKKGVQKSARHRDSKRSKFQGNDHSVLPRNQIPAGWRPVGDATGYGKDKDGHDLPTKAQTPPPALPSPPSALEPLALPNPPPGYRPLSEAHRSTRPSHRYEPYARPPPSLPSYPQNLANEVLPYNYFSPFPDSTTIFHPEPSAAPKRVFRPSQTTIDPMSMLPHPGVPHPQQQHYHQQHQGGKRRAPPTKPRPTFHRRQSRSTGTGTERTLPPPSAPVFFPSIPTRSVSERERHQVERDRADFQVRSVEREYRETRRKWHEARFENVVGGGGGYGGSTSTNTSGGGQADKASETKVKAPANKKRRVQAVGNATSSKSHRNKVGSGKANARVRGGGGGGGGGGEGGNDRVSTNLAIQAAETWAALYAVNERQELEQEAWALERNRLLPPIVVPVEPYRPIAPDSSHPFNFRSSQDPMLGVGPLTAGVEPDEGIQRFVVGTTSPRNGGVPHSSSSSSSLGPRFSNWSNIMSPIMTSPSSLANLGSTTPSATLVSPAAAAAAAAAAPSRDESGVVSSAFEPLGGVPLFAATSSSSSSSSSFLYSNHHHHHHHHSHGVVALESPSPRDALTPRPPPLPPTSSSHDAAFRALDDDDDGDEVAFDERFEPRIESRHDNDGSAGVLLEGGTGIESRGTAAGGEYDYAARDDDRGTTMDWGPFEPRIESRGGEYEVRGLDDVAAGGGGGFESDVAGTRFEDAGRWTEPGREGSDGDVDDADEGEDEGVRVALAAIRQVKERIAA